MQMSLEDIAEKETIQVQSESLNFTVEHRPSTGYGWRVSHLQGEVSIGPTTNHADSDQDTEIGGTFLQTWNFHAKGQGSVTLEYTRTWEKEPIKTVTIDFV